MGKVVLKDGTILDLTQKQSDKLKVMLLFTEGNPRFKLGGREFTMNDIQDDPEEIEKILKSD